MLDYSDLFYLSRWGVGRQIYLYAIPKDLYGWENAKDLVANLSRIATWNPHTDSIHMWPHRNTPNAQLVAERDVWIADQRWYNKKNALAFIVQEFESGLYGYPGRIFNDRKK